MLWHEESIRLDGAPIGHVTSGAYGYSLGAAVGLANIGPEFVTRLEYTPFSATVDVLGVEGPARISLEPFLAAIGTAGAAALGGGA